MGERNARLELDAGWAHLRKGEWALAAEKAATSGADPQAAGMLAALAAYRAGDYTTANRHWLAVLQVDSQNPVASLYLVLGRFQAGETAEAAAVLRRPGFVILPHHGWLADFLIVFWPKRADIVPASSSSSDFIDPFATDYERWKSGREASPKLAESRSFARATTKLAGRYHKAALAAYEKQDLRRATPLFARASELLPESEEYAVHAAFSALLVGDTARAEALTAPFIDHWNQQESLNELPHPDLLAVYAWILHEQGRYRESLLVISSLMPEGPDDWGSHFLCAVNWLRLGDLGRFHAAFEVALRLYFIDTWEQLLRPFVHQTRDWLLAGAGGDSAAT